jgi:twitching motility protein PilT
MTKPTRLADSGFVDLYLGTDYTEVKGMTGALQQLVPAPDELKDDIQNLRNKCIEFHESTRRTEYSLKYDQRLYRVTVANETYIVRQTPESIRPIDKIGLPSDLIHSINDVRQTGLVLVSGEMGSGKTTTAASILSQRIRATGLLGVSIEDPIETLLHGQHGAGRCIQLEVGEHEGYASATKKAFRMGATTFLLGEIRDADTAHEVLKASLSMFVVATIHASSVIMAIEKYKIFCEEKNRKALEIIAQSLYVVTYQELKPVIRGNGILGHQVDIVGFNIKAAKSSSAIRAKISAGDLQSLKDQFNGIEYNF